MVLFETRLQSFQNLNALFDRGFGDIDFLEAPRQRPIFFKNTPVFLIGGRAQAFEFAVGEYGFNQVGGIHGPTGCGTGTNNGMNFINKQHRSRVLFELGQNRLETFFKITAILGAGQQRTQIQ